MNSVPNPMRTMLASRSKDLLCAVEFYSADYIPHVSRGFEPYDAEDLFATETASFLFNGTTVDYVREALSMPSLSRNMGKQSNSITINFSNVSRRLAVFVLNNEVEGMRVVIRLISRADLLNPFGSSWVLFVGRCTKADGFDRKQGSITAKQDLGQIEAMIPPQVFQKDCPLRFKHGDCLGSELLTDKSAAYQAATSCNKTFGQCTDYENTEFFQGIRILQLEGSFIHRPHHGIWRKIFHIVSPINLLIHRKKQIKVGSSVEDGTPYGNAIPIVLGRWQMDGIPLQYKDDGETIHFKEAFCRGPIANFYNIRVNNPEFNDPPVTVVGHYGRYGGQSGQLADTVFPDHSFHSRLAYLTGGVTGSDIEVEDPVPDISAMIAGISAPTVTYLSDSVAGEGTTDTAGVYSLIASAWTDNPVDLIVFLLTDAGALNIPWNFFDQQRTAKTSIYTTGAIKDDTNAERLVLPDTETGKAGVDYRRYNSTGVIAPTVHGPNIGPNFAGPAREVDYEYYDPDSPPTSVPVVTKYRKRYTCNIALTEQKKVVDFINDTLLPTFRGFLSWDSFGRVGVRCERPSDSSLLRSAYSPTVPDIAIDLEADSLGLADNEEIGFWYDDADGDNFAYQGGTGAKPVYKATAGPGGRPCVRFDGNDSMALDVGILSTVYTIFAVIKVADSSLRTIVSGDNNSFGYRIDDLKQNALKNWLFSDIGSSSTNLSTSFFQQICVTYDGTTATFYLGGVVDGTATGAHLFTDPITTIGEWVPGHNNNFEGDMCMLKVYRTVRSGGQLTAEFAAISSRWGV